MVDVTFSDFIPPIKYLMLGGKLIQ